MFDTCGSSKSQGSFNPSSLIPFCAFSNDMSLTGRQVNNLNPPFNFTFPVCNSFKPAIFDGDLCCSIDVSNRIMSDQLNIGFLKEKKLLLAVDPESSLIDSEAPNLGISTGNTANIIPQREKTPSNSISIHLNNLVRHTDARPGIYKLSQLKKMSGTNGFLELPTDIKQCQIEAEEECRTRSFVEALQDRCGCVPWLFQSVIEAQVRKVELG